MEAISKEEMTNIDLDIYSLMKKMPDNENYNSMYIRWDKNTKETFIRVICNVDDLTNLIGVAVHDECEIAEASKVAILNLAIHILKNKPEEELLEFFDIVNNARELPINNL